jgi:hypothetical protein
MQDYIRYELEKRKYSSNVVVGVYEYIDENGKKKEKRDIIVCPVLKKEDGDIYAEFILKQLNELYDKVTVNTK